MNFRRHGYSTRRKPSNDSPSPSTPPTSTGCWSATASSRPGRLKLRFCSFMTQNWIDKYIELCDAVAAWSKDSTKVGAVIVSPTNSIISIGYNGICRGVDDTKADRYVRPAKYLWQEHAERNAIYNAARNGVSTNGSTMVLRWFPCADCGRAILQSGIRHLVCGKPDFTTPVWGEHFLAVDEMFKECGLAVTYHDKPMVRGTLAS